MNPFLFTLILSVLANLIIKPAWVFTENKIQDELGHEVLGIYAALFSFSSIFLVLSDLGISQWNVKEFSGKKELLNQELGKIWGSKVFLSFIFFIACLLSAFLIGYSWYHIQWLFWIILYQLFISGIQLQRGHLQALQLFRLDTLLGNLDKTFLLIFCLILIYIHQLCLETFIDAMLLSAFLPFLLGWFILRKHLEIKKIEWDFTFLKQISKAFMPFALMTILFSTNEKMNQVLIEKIAGEKESGLFAGAYRWNNAIAMYLWTILPIFFAKFANHQKEPKLLQKFFQLGWVIVAIPILYVAFWILFYGEILFIQFTKSQPHEVQKMYFLLKILIWTVALNACFNIFSTWLTACGFVHQTNKILSLAVTSNLILSLVLIPHYGNTGGAIALLIAFIVQSFGFLYLFLKYKNFQLEVSIFAKSIIILIVGLFILWFLYYLQVHWIINTLISTLFIGFFLFQFKLVNWKKE